MIKSTLSNSGNALGSLLLFLAVMAVIPVSSQLVTDFHARGYQPILEQYANRTGVGYLDLLPDLRMHHEQHSNTLVIPFDGHYNGQAHRVMALSTSRHLDAVHLCPE